MILPLHYLRSSVVINVVEFIYLAQPQAGQASMRANLLILLGAVLLSTTCAQQDSQFDDVDEQELDDEDFEEGGSFLDFSRWSEFKTRIQRHVDRDGLLRARRWGNIVNGILLSVTGPVALAASAFGMRLSHIVLSLYVTAFGGLLTGIELGLSPVAPWVSENLIFLTTGRGRTALLAFAGNLIW